MTSQVKVGERCKFTYISRDRDMSQIYTDHSGDTVTVIYAYEDDLGPAYKVVSNDGWVGVAFEDELEVIDG